MSYRALIDAAASLVDTAFLDNYESSPDEAGRDYLRANRNALEAARAALKKECGVSLRYDQDFYAEHGQELGHLRYLAKSLSLELTQAKLGDEFDRAARIGVELLELGNAVRRGGLVTDFLVSIAFSSMAVEGVRGMRPHHDESTRTWLRDELARIEKSRESLDVILVRDRKWEVAVGWHDQTVDLSTLQISELETGISKEEQQAVQDAMQEILDLPGDARAEQYHGFDHRDLAMQRLLFVDLALRSYQAIHQGFPENLNSLVPTVCSDVPRDPFTDELFCYQRQAKDKFVLYSPGPTPVDHGGNFGNWLAVSSGKADLCLDIGDYWWDEQVYY